MDKKRCETSFSGIGGAYCSRSGAKDIFTRPSNIKTTKHLRRTPMKFRPLHDRVVVKRIEAGASSSPTPLRRSHSKAKSSPLALVGAMKPAS
jgi:outer membrane protease